MSSADSSRGAIHAGLLFVLVIVAVGAVGYLLLAGQDTEDDVQDLSREPETVEAEADREASGVGGLSAAPGSKTAEQRSAEAAATAGRDTSPPCSRDKAVYGFVMDGRKKPIAGAEVRLIPIAKEDLDRSGTPDREAAASATTGSDGAYFVGPAPPGLMKVRAEAAGYAPTVQPVSKCGARVDLILDLGGSLVVHVQDSAGAGVAGAAVVHTAGTVSTNGTTDAAGLVRLPSVPTGTGELIVSKEGFAAARRNDVAVAPGDQKELTILLLPTISLTGRVVEEATGRPVAGARVKINYTSVPGIAPAAPVVADESGAFRTDLAVGPPEQIEVVAESGEWAPAQVWLNVADSGAGTMDTVLKMSRRGPAIRGRVDDSEGRPAEGVMVTLAWQGTTKGPEAKTDDKGRFELAAPGGSSAGTTLQLLALRDDGAMGAGYYAFPKPDGPPAQPLVIRLTGSGRVMGRVNDAAGNAVEGAIVSLKVDWGLMRTQRGGRGQPNWMVMNVLQDSRRFPLDGVTVADGTYEIVNVPASTFRLSASHGLGTATGAEPVVVQPGQVTYADLVLGDGETIEGVVQDDKGAPVPGAWVNANLRMRDGGWGGRWVSARSQSDGTFALRGVSDGEWWLSANASGFSGAEAQNVAPGRRDVVLKLTAMGWVEGVVLEGGRPYRGQFTVSAVSQQREGAGENVHQMGQNQGTFNTDDGKFELRGLGAGSYVLQAATPDGRISAEGVPVEIANGRAATGVTIPLVTGATLTGIVESDETRQPLQASQVTAQGRGSAGGSNRGGQGATTDASGRFTIRGLVPGPHTVFVTPPSSVYWQEEVEIHAGTNERRFVERAGGKINIRVVDSEGRPLANAQPTVSYATGTQLWPSWQAYQKDGLTDTGGNAWERMIKTDASGVNLRHHVPPGRYRVSAILQDYAPPEEPPWVDVSSRRTTDVTVVMKSQPVPRPAGDR